MPTACATSWATELLTAEPPVRSLAAASSHSALLRTAQPPKLGTLRAARCSLPPAPLSAAEAPLIRSGPSVSYGSVASSARARSRIGDARAVADDVGAT